MANRIIATLMVVAGSLLFGDLAYAGSGVCEGKRIRPKEDVCWDCIYPFTVGGETKKNPDSRRDASDNPRSGECECSCGQMTYKGKPLGYWIPGRFVDVTRTPYCYVNGLTKDNDGKQKDNERKISGTYDSDNSTAETSGFYHVHWRRSFAAIWEFRFKLPVTDARCYGGNKDRQPPTDWYFFTEWLKLWGDEKKSNVFTPGSHLMAGLLGQALCGLDCLSATFFEGRPEMFQCAGCQGSLTPYIGHVDAHTGQIQASLLLTQRLAAYLHRTTLAQQTSGQAALCFPVPMPYLKKNQYKVQLTFPKTITDGFNAAIFMGASGWLIETGKERPDKADVGFLVFRKENCCGNGKCEN